MNKTLVVALVAATLWMPVTSAEDPCTNDGGLVDHTTLALGTDNGDARFYADVRELVGDETLFSIWIYQESNGDLSGPNAGLQRGGAAWWDPTNKDNCSDALAPGTAFPDTVWL